MVLEGLILNSFQTWEDVLVLQRLIFVSLDFRGIYWSQQDWFWISTTLRWCGGPKRTDFHFFTLGGCGVLKGLIWIIYTLGGCGGLGRTGFGHFLHWEHVVSWKDWFGIISTLGGFVSVLISDFEYFLYWEGVVIVKGLNCHCQFSVWEDVIGLEGVILDNFNFRGVWWSWKDWFWIIGWFGFTT